MKKIFYIAAAALSLLAAASCSKEVKEDVLEVSVSSTLVGVEGTSQTISFSTNNPWTISSDKDWVSFDVTSGEAGSGTVELTVAANDTYDARSAKVTLSAAGKSYSFTVNQLGNNAFGSVVPITVSSAEQEILIPVVSNVDYTVTVAEECASWISASKAAVKSAPVESVVTISIAANNTLFPREGVFSITAGGNTQAYTLTQESDYEAMSEAAAVYLGSVQDIYNEETYEYNSFNQFALSLTNEEGCTVVLALNATAADTLSSVFPVGEFSVDATGAHAEHTFSLKSTSGHEKYYTTINNGSEIQIIDGEISVSAEDSVYTVTAILLDAAEVRHSYSYQGEIEVADKSFGAECTDLYLTGQYNTYFAGGAQQWSVSLMTSAKDKKDNPVFLRNIYLTIYGTSAQNSELPTGDFTYEVPEEDSALSYANGITKANPQTFTFTANNGNWADVVPAEGTAPKLSVSKNEDGTYNFTFKGNFELTEYDDNYDALPAVSFSYDGTFTDVYMPAFDKGVEPAPDDIDVEFNYVFNSKYPVYYYGHVFDENNDVFYTGFSEVNNNYAVNISLNVKGDYVFEKNFANRFCSTPFNFGTFTYSASAADNTVIPVKQNSAAKLYINNNYTGSTYYITGGSVTVTSSSITYNLTAKRKGGDKEVKFTGTHDATLYYVMDYTKYASKLALFTIE